MVFRKIEDTDLDIDAPCWISGIYKIVLYEFNGNRREKRKHYGVYYIAKGQKNWGDHVDKATPEYRTLQEAKRACEKHKMENES